MQRVIKTRHHPCAEIEVVKTVPDLTPEEVKGGDWIPDPYANIAILSKKGSGKTNLVYNIVRHCTYDRAKDPDAPPTTVYIISPTLHHDKMLFEMKAMMRARGVEFEAYDNIIQDGGSIIDEILSEVPPSYSDDPEEDPVTIHYKTVETTRIVNGERVITRKQVPIEPPREEPRKKYPVAQERIFILDDNGNAARHPSVGKLMRTNRHYRAKVIVSSQWLNDLEPASVKQLGVCLLFRSFNPQKLKDIHKALDLFIDYEDFQELYDYATREPYSFFYIDKNGKFRKGFSQKLIISACKTPPVVRG